MSRNKICLQIRNTQSYILTKTNIHERWLIHVKWKKIELGNMKKVLEKN